MYKQLACSRRSDSQIHLFSLYNLKVWNGLINIGLVSEVAQQENQLSDQTFQEVTSQAVLFFFCQILTRKQLHQLQTAFSAKCLGQNTFDRHQCVRFSYLMAFSGAIQELDSGIDTVRRFHISFFFYLGERGVLFFPFILLAAYY